MALSFDAEFRNSLKDKYAAIAAIDFGTTFSGFAFSLNHKDGNQDIYLNREWGNALGYSTLQTPTCILLSPKKEFVNFGYEAAAKYAELEDGKDQTYYFFDRFKMMLHHSEEKLNRDTLLKARNGEIMRALDIFSKSLEYMKDKALEQIYNRSGVKYKAEEVRWVVTVPAIWKPSAKQFMREAAYKAGLASPDNYTQLIIALEPEAAAVYCRQRKLWEFVGMEKGDRTVDEALVSAKTQYLVIDNGGGTMDVTAHEIQEDDTIKEIYHATGGDYGGTKVDGKFQDLLDVLFGQDFMDEFRSSRPSDWLELINDFEVKKRAADYLKQGREEQEPTNIRFPDNFFNFFRSKERTNEEELRRKRRYVASFFNLLRPRSKNREDYNRARDDDGSLLNRMVRSQDEGIKIVKNRLSLGSDIVKHLFKPAVESIVSHLTELLKKQELEGVELLFLVGGFSECPFLQDRIREEFEHKYKILIPGDAQTAVVKGAVMFGQRPQIVAERCLSETYGTRCYSEFDPDLHKKEKLEYIEKKAKCKDIFFVLAKENEQIKIGESKKTSKFQPVRKNDTQLGFSFFTSSNPDVLYTTDEGVKRLPGHILVDSPDTSKGTDRTIELRLYFETEIKVVAVDLETEKEASTFIDFLSHN